MNWKEMLDRAVSSKRSLLCVGLDTDMARFGEDADQLDINRSIIRATADLAVAYKPNMAFYEAEGYRGMKVLEETIKVIRDEAPNTLIILDAKKGDIGNTSRAYARSAFEVIGADSITVNAYMGRDAVEPFSEYQDKLIFVLCRTSNKGASEVQDLIFGDERLYNIMARNIRTWDQHGNLGAVVGATYPEELGRVREILGPSTPILIPGVGTQGGDLKKVLTNGTNEEGTGVLINVSRGIMFAFLKDEYQGLSMGEAARRETLKLHGMIRAELTQDGRW